MSDPQHPAIPVTVDDVDHDLDAIASQPPGTRGSTRRLGLLAQAEATETDPGHLATEEEWAAIVARAENGRP